MKYVIYNMADVSNIDFSEIGETSKDTLRLSVNGEQTVLKFTGDTPGFLVGLTQYTHSEILPIMRSAEWAHEPMSPPPKKEDGWLSLFNRNKKKHPGWNKKKEEYEGEGEQCCKCCMMGGNSGDKKCQFLIELTDEK